jgi:hypothetical protein
MDSLPRSFGAVKIIAALAYLETLPYTTENLIITPVEAG